MWQEGRGEGQREGEGEGGRGREREGEGGRGRRGGREGGQCRIAVLHVTVYVKRYKRQQKSLHVSTAYPLCIAL